MRDLLAYPYGVTLWTIGWAIWCLAVVMVGLIALAVAGIV